MTSHDVRHLKPCATCEKLGDKRKMIKESGGRVLHGRCYIEQYGLDALLALQEEQVGVLALDDIGAETMRAVMDKFFPSTDDEEVLRDQDE
jgi:hypothetical protein